MIDEKFAFITCECGEKIQVLNEDGSDWSEIDTATAYNEHLTTHVEKTETTEIKE